MVQFTEPASYSVGTGPGNVTTGDFNLDGSRDLAVTNGLGVSILLNNGDGTFGTALDYSAGVNPHDVVTADFNGDRHALVSEEKLAQCDYYLLGQLLGL